MTSGYFVQADRADESSDSDVVAELVHRGYEPFAAGDPIDTGSSRNKANVLMQAGAEYLAKLGGAKTRDIVSASMLNRGLLTLLRRRDEFGTGTRNPEG